MAQALHSLRSCAPLVIDGAAVVDIAMELFATHVATLQNRLSTVKMWLDYLLSGTRRFYLLSLSPARPPYRLYLSPPSRRPGT